jgi:CheY-like chemotaxis protein
LHEDLATRSIPIIICTVVREEDLAYSLGATGFLSKPIQPQELVQALDQARRRVSEAAET